MGDFSQRAKASERNKTWKVIKGELEHALKSYEVNYNKTNKDNPNFQAIAIKFFEQKLQGNPDHPEIVMGVALGIELIRGGESHIMMRKVSGFNSFQQFERIGEQYKLDLCREILYELVGGGVSFFLAQLSMHEGR